jgi:hypothetical protein
MSQSPQKFHPRQSIDKLSLRKIIGVGWVCLLVFAVVAVSGCSGNCKAGGNTYGGKVLCKALDF